MTFNDNPGNMPWKESFPTTAKDLILLTRVNVNEQNSLCDNPEYTLSDSSHR